MRQLTDHRANPLNDKLVIGVMDEPGVGGANHEYTITVIDDDKFLVQQVRFQNGPIAEHGINGVTQEALLAICIDRLRSFQNSRYACRENALALTHLEDAMHWLHHRTRQRMQRGVEGTSVV